MNDQRITARELRIGNKLMIGKYLITVAELYTDEFKTPEEGVISYSHPQLRGLPLTEEWLLKFGVTKHEGNALKNISLPYWALDAVCLFFNGSPPENTYLVGVGFNVGPDYYAATTRWINTVHELQNFYYQAKGSELTIKETGHHDSQGDT